MIAFVLIVIVWIIIHVVTQHRAKPLPQLVHRVTPRYPNEAPLSHHIQQALLGNSCAQTCVIEAYLLGRGTPVNPVEAMAWLHHIGRRRTWVQNKILILLEEKHGPMASMQARARAAEIPNSPFLYTQAAEHQPAHDSYARPRHTAGQINLKDLGLEPNWDKPRKRAHLLKEFARTNSRMQSLRDPAQLAECQARLDRITRAIMELDGDS